MAWTASKIFRQAVADMFGNVGAMDWDADSFKIAHFNNSVTPDQNVTAANSAYNVAQWGTANEVYQAGQWAQGGIVIPTTTLTTPVGGAIMLDGGDAASGAAATLSNLYGGQVYDDTLTSPVADPGVCYLYYGGVASVSNGTLTVQFASTGIVRIDVS